MTDSSTINFGNLQGLIGNWTGSNGVNLVAVPDQKGEFTLLIAPYTETLNVKAVSAATPNRGLQSIEKIPTLSYDLSINNSDNNSLMHVENGFWEVMNPVGNASFDVSRLATIPHGNSLVAMGNSSVISGAPTIDVSQSAVPFGDLPTTDGYTDEYIMPSSIQGFFPTAPNQYLVEHLQKQINSGITVTETTIINISTNNKGGISNIPSLYSNANATQFDATFWIETLQDSSGKIIHQLQYSQRTLITFPIKSNLPGQTIIWPHFNVNTLTLTA